LVFKGFQFWQTLGRSVIKLTIMKTLTFFILFLIAGVTAHASKNPCHIQVLSDKSDIFYFKADNEFLGANIEIYSSTGEKIMEQMVERHKVIIDFVNEQLGDYTIKIVKEGKTFTFTYTKTEKLSFATTIEQPISISQY
jgi:hypothetical protein